MRTRAEGRSQGTIQKGGPRGPHIFKDEQDATERTLRRRGCGTD